MVFFIVGCVKRRSTRTTIVLSCLSLTTTPCSIRFGIAASSLRFRLCRALLLRDGANAGDVTTDLTHPRRVLELPRRALEAQVELLLLELHQLVVELVDAHHSKISGFQHDAHQHYSAMRSTKRVLIGSLAAANASASRAIWTGTPSISNRMRPGLTRATQYSTAPLPDPMRTSSGFLLTGTSG